MVTVVATQDLEPGDVLRRFKAEATQDAPRGGNDNNRYSRSTSALCISLACWCFFVVVDGTRVCVTIGNNNNGYIVVAQVGVDVCKLSLHVEFLSLLVCCVFFFFC